MSSNCCCTQSLAAVVQGPEPNDPQVLWPKSSFLSWPKLLLLLVLLLLLLLMLLMWLEDHCMKSLEDILRCNKRDHLIEGLDGLQGMLLYVDFWFSSGWFHEGQS